MLRRTGKCQPAGQNSDDLAIDGFAEMQKTVQANRAAFKSLCVVAGDLSGDIVEVQQGIVSVQQGQLEIKKGQLQMRQDMHQGQTEIHGRIDSVTTKFNAFVKTCETNNFTSGLKGMIYPYVHHGFHGASGNNFFCPFAFTDHAGLYRELCAISLPNAGKFFLEECPAKIPVDTTTSFFLSPTFIRATGLNYKDIINGLLLTGMAFLAVGPGWNQMRLRNTAKFVFVEAAFMKNLLRDIDNHIPDRPRSRSDFVHGGHVPSYKVNGVDFGFRQASREDKSTGPIVQIRRTIPPERKKQMPVMAEAWVQEWYTPMVAQFFNVPHDMVGVHHVNSSVVDPTSDLVKKHAQAIGEYRRRQSASAARKRQSATAARKRRSIKTKS